MHKLNPRQRVFCRAYAEGASGAEAVRHAGYSPRSARYQARDLLGKPHIREAIAEAQAAIEANRLPPVTDHSLEGHLRALAWLRDEALAAGQYTVALRAEVARRRAMGASRADERPSPADLRPDIEALVAGVARGGARRAN